MFIDTHSHIYSKEFDNDRPEMLRRAFEASVSTILMPAIDSATHPLMLELEADHPGRCISMIGLHPCSVKEDLQEELNRIEVLLKQRPFVAIGETGLDFYWDLSFKEQQIEAFERQIGWALEYRLPVVIHSRESTDDCIAIIKKYTPHGLRGVFHCFGGSISQAMAIIEEGFYLGIGGVLTFKKSGLDQVMKQLPLDHVVLETDAPYLAPVPFRGKRNEPAWLPQIAQKLAEVTGTDPDEIAAVTTANAKKLFAL
ncbi:TatD family hydrolase [Niabella drilacis]|uniref:TatD DNase family protein n=1 Tax=Niabella drilacis (strain DSM 25811 / CCM 8410 / CCUG 62505 / LMG 26954 / E90) TaxID=1285928 RepID=A0A1G6VMW0_NIADE|nr:TatD family hydrolase [Niabella drilacis]SDD54367.1 TatD DNase family protein [Niabella drilacis]